MMNLTSAIRVTLALTATTICFGALAGPLDGCYEDYFDDVEPCIGPCATNPNSCKIVHKWTSYCALGGHGCTMGSYFWYYAPHDKYHCGAGPNGNGDGSCICGTGQIIEQGWTPQWIRDCNG